MCAELAFDISDIKEHIDKMAENVVKYMIDENLTLSTAESCTGGLISSAVTAVPGASKVFGCGVVSYSEAIKQKLLSVPAEIISKNGVVSPQTALFMAKGVKNLSGSDISAAVTGLAGPKSENDSQPVGTVYLAIVFKDKEYVENLRLYELGNFGREQNRLLTVYFALERTYKILRGADMKEGSDYVDAE